MIIDRYLRHEIGMPLLAIALVLLIIFSTYSLTLFLVDANAGLLLPAEVILLTALKALVALEVLLPLSLYFAVMLGLGRLYSDSEIHVLRSGGISERRLMRPVTLLALALAVLVGALSVWVRPWAYAHTYRIRAEAMSVSEVDRVRPGRFYRFEDSGRTVFIGGLDPDALQVQRVFIRTRRGDDLQVITAASGWLEPAARPSLDRLTLEHAQLFRRTASGPDVFAELDRFSLWIPVREPELVGYRTKASPTPMLLDSDDAVDRAELQWRLSTPASTLLLALLAIPLSRTQPRQGRYGRILLALAIYAVYFNLLDVNRIWVEQGAARHIGWVPGGLAIAVGVMYLPWHRWRRWRARLARRAEAPA